jgi:hypothetical protein
VFQMRGNIDRERAKQQKKVLQLGFRLRHHTKKLRQVNQEGGEIPLVAAYVSDPKRLSSRSASLPRSGNCQGKLHPYNAPRQPPYSSYGKSLSTDSFRVLVHVSEALKHSLELVLHDSYSTE